MGFPAELYNKYPRIIHVVARAFMSLRGRRSPARSNLLFHEIASLPLAPLAMTSPSCRCEGGALPPEATFPSVRLLSMSLRGGPCRCEGVHVVARRALARRRNLLFHEIASLPLAPLAMTSPSCRCEGGALPPEATSPSVRLLRPIGLART